MRIINDISYVSPSPCVVALGCFDGVHLGHAKVIGEAVKLAGEYGVSSAVWAFAEPPRNFFKKCSVPIITDGYEKARLIKELGANCFFSIPFDEAIKDITPEDFLEVFIKNRLKAVHVVCGFNYSFGKNGMGNTEVLRDFCRKNGIGLTVLPPYTIEGKTVSASEIRALVEAGKVAEAARALGRYYSLSSPVVNGKRLARRLGFPTINQLPDPRLLTPKKGVYVTRVSFDGFRGFGITNVGTRPTVGESVLSAETNIFNFDGDLYEKKVTLEFLSFIRPETCFPSVDEMAQQIRNDIATARSFLADFDMNCQK